MRKKRIRITVIILLALLLGAAGFVLLHRLSPGAMPRPEMELRPELKEAQAERQSISKSLVAGGFIAENTAQAISLAGDIGISRYLVSRGDYVQAGEPVAEVDRDSIILAIHELMQVMAELDGELDASRNDIIENAIYSPAKGRVKAIHARPGDEVREVMGEHSALMRLSMDGLMAADIALEKAPARGSPVVIRLSDGTELPGQAEKTVDGVCTFTLSDEFAPYGDRVEIYDSENVLLGEAELYIHMELQISGRSGTVHHLNVAENMIVDSDMAMIVLTDIADSANREILTQRRRELEEEIRALFEAYNSGFISAECTGYVLDINTELTAKRLSAESGDTVGSMDSSAVTVLSVSGSVVSVSYVQNGSELKKDVDIGSVPVFVYSGGSLRPSGAGQVKAGDSLVLAFYNSGGSAVLDHVVIYPAGNTGNNQSGGNSQGGSQSGSQSGKSGSTAGSSGGAGVGGTASDEENYDSEKTIIMYISPFDTAEIELSVDELDVVNYEKGKAVEVYFDALPGQCFEGTVTGTDPKGTNEGGNTKYTVCISVERTREMLSGMNATVKTEIETLPEALTIPLAALYESGGETFVYTGWDEKEEKLLNPVSVETGLSDGSSVQIVSGLEEGDSVFYLYTDKISYSYHRQ